MKTQQRARKALGSSLTDINHSLRNDSRRRFEGGTNVMARPKLAPLRTSRVLSLPRGRASSRVPPPPTIDNEKAPAKASFSSPVEPFVYSLLG